MNASFRSFDADNAVRRQLMDFPFPRRAKMLLGLSMLPIFRAQVEGLQQDPFREGRSGLEKLLRNGLLAKAFLDSDRRRLRSMLANYWVNSASSFSQWSASRFQRMFMRHDIQVIRELKRRLASHPELTSLYEIGCGSGQLLNFLSEFLPSIREFHGIDLGENQIEQNRLLNEKDAVHYHAADAVDWVNAHARPGSVFVANGGVFEYFLQEEVEAFLGIVARQLAPAAVVLIETIGSNHDLATENESMIYGREMAFSHNYPHLLRKAGFEIQHQSERTGYAVDGGGRWIRLLATID